MNRRGKVACRPMLPTRIVGLGKAFDWLADRNGNLLQGPARIPRLHRPAINKIKPASSLSIEQVVAFKHLYLRIGKLQSYRLIQLRPEANHGLHDSGRMDDLKSWAPAWVPDWFVSTNLMFGIAPLPVIIGILATLLTAALYVQSRSEGAGWTGNGLQSLSAQLTWPGPLATASITRGRQ